MSNWEVYKGDNAIKSDWKLPDPPSWRLFKDSEAGAAERENLKGQHFVPPEVAIKMVNASIHLRRPLLITGEPGTGKSTLAYSLARELGLGKVLKWSIATRTTIKDGLYSYDAIARLQDAQIAKLREVENTAQIGDYITLGSLGTAFLPANKPRVLLIDEIDKSDIDLPNDLLNLFEEGEFPIVELQRSSISSSEVNSSDRNEQGEPIRIPVQNGFVRCRAFPIVIMTSNGERDFPPPFLRRCLRVKMPRPGVEQLKEIVTKHFNTETMQAATALIEDFDRACKARNEGSLAVDQLLNAVHMRLYENSEAESQKDLRDRLWKYLTSTEDA